MRVAREPEETCAVTGGSNPISWIDITSDTNAPGTWTWTDVSNLDLDVTAILPTGNGKLRVYKVEVRVTYTP